MISNLDLIAAAMSAHWLQLNVLPV